MDPRQVLQQGSFDFEAGIPASLKKQRPGEGSRLPWVSVRPGVPYFIKENGKAWTPIGQNDAITWPELAGLFRRKNMNAVDSYFGMLAASGVTCIRLMLEYCQGENRYLERPAGTFQANMIRLWDDIFALCEKHALRLLLTPYDTFWMWKRWSHHPYNIVNGGPCSKRSQWLLCERTREAIKTRLHFATSRWGGSGALFGWDLWNEIRPAHGGNSAKGFTSFISDVSGFLRESELALHGRAHPQTVSVFSPVLQKDKRIAEAVFHHPSLDFATIHLYEQNTIDNPSNTIDAAITTGRIIRDLTSEIKDQRPFFDSEHGPIKTFSGYGKTLREDFDDEYFRHMQWAHLASGGAGGGMRWPYRFPHVLTPGMRAAQLSLSRFIPLISWERCRRVNLNGEIKVSDPGLAVFGSGDQHQAIAWLLRVNAIGKNKMLRTDTAAEACRLEVPMLLPGLYNITFWHTRSGTLLESIDHHNSGTMNFEVPAVVTDIAIAITHERTTGANKSQAL